MRLRRKAIKVEYWKQPNNHIRMKLLQGPSDHDNNAKLDFTSMLSICAYIDTSHRHQNKR